MKDLQEAIPNRESKPFDYDTSGAASYIEARPSTLEKWRHLGIGPAYMKVGHKVRYSRADLDAYIASRRITPKAS